MPKQINKYLILTGAAAQMGVTIYLGARLGKYIDYEAQTGKNYYTLIFTLLAVAISLYLLLKQLKKLNDS